LKDRLVCRAFSNGRSGIYFYRNANDSGAAQLCDFEIADVGIIYEQLVGLFGFIRSTYFAGITKHYLEIQEYQELIKELESSLDKLRFKTVLKMPRSECEYLTEEL
jgi:hypothetical protein